jgi:hypothetical protein
MGYGVMVILYDAMGYGAMVQYGVENYIKITTSRYHGAIA